MYFNPNTAPFRIEGNITVLKLCVYDMEDNKVFEERLKVLGME
jgi:hypothetical protein